MNKSSPFVTIPVPVCLMLTRVVMVTTIHPRGAVMLARFSFFPATDPLQYFFPFYFPTSIQPFPRITIQLVTRDQGPAVCNTCHLNKRKSCVCVMSKSTAISVNSTLFVLRKRRILIDPARLVRLDPVQVYRCFFFQGKDLTGIVNPVGKSRAFLYLLQKSRVYRSCVVFRQFRQLGHLQCLVLAKFSAQPHSKLCSPRRPAASRGRVSSLDKK